MPLLKVSNEAHCIKLATDFLSVEALSVCEGLASEFREENLHDAWKDDVLQLHNQLYYAWLSLQRPLENARQDFHSVESVHVPMAKASLSHSRKHKYCDGDEDNRDPKQLVRCTICSEETKSFYKHGLTSHM
jgi:hypothetical protein